MATSRQFKTISRCYGAERSSTSLSDHLGVHYTSEDWDAAMADEDLTPDPGVVGVTASGLFYLTSTNTFMVGQSNFKGRKNYELTNHTSTTLSDRLGNVMAVVSDKLTKYSVVEAGVIPYSLPNMVSATDYDPFGMALEQREWQHGGVEEYGFGFNGKIEDPEILDRGRWEDYGFRAYRPDLGRFVSVDPLSSKYPELTTYQFASNTPICAVDLDGLEMFYTASGRYIGTYGKSSAIRVVHDRDLTLVTQRINNAQSGDRFKSHKEMELQNMGIEAFIDNTENKQMLFRRFLTTVEPIIEKPVGDGEYADQEYGMSLFRLDTKGPKNESITLIVPGTIADGFYPTDKGGGHVDLILSAAPTVMGEKYGKYTKRTPAVSLTTYGWQRYDSIHNHPGKDQVFSDEWGQFGNLSGDVKWACDNNVKLYICNPGNVFASEFDPVKFKKHFGDKNPDKLSFEWRREGIDVATNKTAIRMKD
jgi:RHS repeat-associated protein